MSWSSKWRLLRGTLQTEGNENSVVSVYYGPFLYYKYETSATSLLMSQQFGS